jgi:threonine/homoserine/homoserine lactone efflux protein
MHANITAFAGVAALVILAPGPDTALVTKNALRHGRRAALATSFGVVSGLIAWTLAAALGRDSSATSRTPRSPRSSPASCHSSSLRACP